MKSAAKHFEISAFTFNIFVLWSDENSWNHNWHSLLTISGFMLQNLSYFWNTKNDIMFTLCKYMALILCHPTLLSIFPLRRRSTFKEGLNFPHWSCGETEFKDKGCYWYNCFFANTYIGRIQPQFKFFFLLKYAIY